MTRDQYLSSIFDKLYASPDMFPYVQFIYRSSKKEYEKYIVHRSDERFIAEYWDWDWDWDLDFSRLTRKANLELVKTNQYEPALTKTDRTINPHELEKLITEIHKMNINPQKFEFSEGFILNHGSFSHFEMRNLANEVKLKWINSPPREWSGIKEVIRELVEIVAGKDSST